MCIKINGNTKNVNVVWTWLKDKGQSIIHTGWSRSHVKPQWCEDPGLFVKAKLNTYWAGQKIRKPETTTRVWEKVDFWKRICYLHFLSDTKWFLLESCRGVVVSCCVDSLTLSHITGSVCSFSVTSWFLPSILEKVLHCFNMWPVIDPCRVSFHNIVKVHHVPENWSSERWLGCVLFNHGSQLVCFGPSRIWLESWRWFWEKEILAPRQMVSTFLN